ncbi:MAG: conjugal transfer protein [Lachnospiraceae bacterium]|nr:conjugal transfer protein [Lachnospiraceae bacterium]
MIVQNWLYWSLCGNKTPIRIRKNIILINFTLYYPKCRQENLIIIKNQDMKIIQKLDALHAESINL